MLVVKIQSFGADQIWASKSALYCMWTLGNLLHLPGSQFSHLKNGKVALTSGILRCLSESTDGELPTQRRARPLGHSSIHYSGGFLSALLWDWPVNISQGTLLFRVISESTSGDTGIKIREWDGPQFICWLCHLLAGDVGKVRYVLCSVVSWAIRWLKGLLDLDGAQSSARHITRA